VTDKDETPNDADQTSGDDEQPTDEQDRGPTSVPDLVPAGGSRGHHSDDPVDQLSTYLQGEYDEAAEAEILNNPRVRRLLTIVSEQTMEFTTGEIPPPTLLAAYERIHPGAKEIFFSHHHQQMEMTQAEQNHRHAFENRLLDHNIESERKGQHIATRLAGAFLLASLLAFGFALALGFENAAIAAVGAIVIEIVGLAGVFLGTRPRAVKRVQKPSELPPGDLAAQEPRPD